MNEQVKKVLYKEKPIAEQLYNEDNNVVYGCDTSLGRVLFCVPINEASGFNKKESAQLLIRWIVKN